MYGRYIMKKRIIIMLFVFSCLCSIAGLSNAEEDIGVRILSEIGSSVVRIMVDQGDDNVSIGTGFFINNRYVVTNHHVVSTSLKSNIIGDEGWFKSAKGNDALVVFSEEREDWSLGIVIEDWPEVDLALIDLRFGTSKRTPVKFTSESDIKNGMDVFVVGFPGIFSNAYDLSTVDEPKITKGNLVSIITHNTYEDGLTDYKQQCYSALINPGNSGGPVVDKNGNVIGVANASINNNGEIGYFGIDFRELTLRLDKAGISYFMADSSYSSYAPTPIPEINKSPDPQSSGISVKVGDIITFGQYEQDDNSINGPEEIEWQVLAVENGKALLISKYAIDAIPYDLWERGDYYLTWEECSLREWLNVDFYNSAFSIKEKSAIMEVMLSNKDNPVYYCEGGNDTIDRVFLLSIEEAQNYFNSDSARQCKSVAYAKGYNNNSRISTDWAGNTWWWLRSPGGISQSAAGVTYSGVIDPGGRDMYSNIGVIRPAIWLKL